MNLANADYSALEAKLIAHQAKNAGVCKHSSARLFSWFVGSTLCVCCCDCGAVLHGGAK